MRAPGSVALSSQLRRDLALIAAPAGAAIVLLRSIPVLVHPAFLREEVAGWWNPTFALPPLDTLLLPWNGFAYPAIRAVFLLARLVPDYAPLVTFGFHVAGIALVAGFLASDRMEALPNRHAAALALAVVPLADAVVFSTVINVHWFFSIYLAALLVARPGRPWVDRVCVFIAATSTPAVLVLAPLYLWRRMDRGVLLAVGVGFALQLVTFLTAPRIIGTGRPILEVIERVGLLPLGDRLGWLAVGWPLLGIVLAAVVLALTLRASVFLPRPTLLVFGYLAVATIAVEASGLTPGRELWPTEGERFFLPMAWLLAVIALSALRHWSGRALAAVFVVGMVWSFAIPAVHGPAWGTPPPGPVVVGMDGEGWLTR